MSESETQLHAVVCTDVGVVRDHNEDSAFIDPDNRFFIVADGMGGHAAGEVASAMAVETVREELTSAGELIGEFATQPSDRARKKLIEALETAVRKAHQAVYDRGANESDKQGMGTTLDVLLVAGADAFVAHVGDSRTYLIRDGKAAQITTDHTVAEVLVIEGKLTVEEAAASPLRTILVNAIGVAADVGVEMAHLRLKTGDYVLLCSDGLHDYFPLEQEIADYTIDQEKIDEALGGMVEIAKERGGHDNITGVLVEVKFAPEAPDEPMFGADDDAVPQEIARDDTKPVDVETILSEEEKAKATQHAAEQAANAHGDDSEDDESGDDESGDESEDDESGDDSGGDDSGGDDSGGDDSGGDEDEDDSPKAKTAMDIAKEARSETETPPRGTPRSDLKTTVPLKPLKVPPTKK